MALIRPACSAPRIGGDGQRAVGDGARQALPASTRRPAPRGEAAARVEGPLSHRLPRLEHELRRATCTYAGAAPARRGRSTAKPAGGSPCAIRRVRHRSNKEDAAARDRRSEFCSGVPSDPQRCWCCWAAQPCSGCRRRRRGEMMKNLPFAADVKPVGQDRGRLLRHARACGTRDWSIETPASTAVDLAPAGRRAPAS